MYREAPSRIAGAVLWHSVRPVGAAPTRVLPDGCIDLIWSSETGLLVAGPDTTAQLAAGPTGERYVGLRLPPGTGPAVLGVPADRLRDQRLPLAALWSERLARELTARAFDGSTPAAPGTAVPDAATPLPGTVTAEAAAVAAVLEAVAADRLREAGGPDPAAALLTRRLGAGRPVAAVAVELGVGARQLHRRSQVLFGYGPKTLARILRLRRALALARTGLPAAEVAARTGYADQPHLSRDIRDLAGVPLGVLLSTGPAVPA
ncbi:helix-turn-helix domain-containing protein [Micromonospora zhanjiangensis]|uniref:Helix-turn-helix domain-containing protein n=1 Tax=Micromonospora zhanjiangensis TaxID=1522057 RepID=A0ABV8KTE9_9ACTN